MKYLVQEFDPTWVEYVYEVEAESKEDAIEKVGTGEFSPMGPGEIGGSVESMDSDYEVEEMGSPDGTPRNKQDDEWLRSRRVGIGSGEERDVNASQNGQN